MKRDNEEFFKVFQNKFIRNKIFGFIRNLHKELFYFTYDFYNLPIDIIINNNNKYLLINKLKLYKQYIIDNQNNIHINNNYYKYYIEFNKFNIFSNKDNCDILFSKWKDLDNELLDLIEKLFPDILVYKSYHLVDSMKNSNLEIFKRVEERLGFPRRLIMYADLDIGQSLDNQIIEMFNYLKEYYNSSITKKSSSELLKKVMRESKSFYLADFFFNNLKIIDKYSLLNVEFKSLFIEAIEFNNIEMVKYLLSKLDQTTAIANGGNSDSCNTDNDKVYLVIYGYKILKSELKEIKRDSFSGTRLVELLEEIYQYTKLEEPFLNVKTPELAEFLLSTINYPVEKMIFQTECLREDYSNLDLFSSRQLIEWSIKPSKYSRSLAKVLSFQNSKNSHLIKQWPLDYFRYCNDCLLGVFFSNIEKNSKCISNTKYEMIKDIRKYIRASFQGIFKALEGKYDFLDLHPTLLSILKLSKSDLCYATNLNFFFNNKFNERIELINQFSRVPLLLKSYSDYIGNVKRSILNFNKYKFCPSAFSGISNINIDARNIMKSVELYGLSNYILDYFNENRIKEYSTIKSVFNYSITNNRNQKLILYLIQENIIQVDLISLVSKAIKHIPNTFIIDLLLLKIQFKNNKDSNNNLFNIIINQNNNNSNSNNNNKKNKNKNSINKYQPNIKSVTEYLNFIHYFILYISFISDRYEIVKYLLKQNYRFKNNSFIDGSYLDRFSKELSFNNLNNHLSSFLNNVDLLKFNNLSAINLNNNHNIIDYNQINNSNNNNLTFNF